MSVRDTSKLAYDEISPSIGKEQSLVLQTIGKAKRPVNDRELSDYLKKAINTITPRRKELVDLGKVELAFKAVYPVTKRKVAYWKITDEVRNNSH